MLRRTMLIGGMSAAAFIARAQSMPDAAVSELAPGGLLRAAINYGNAVLAQRDGAAKLSGVSVDIAHELGRRLAVPVELVPFEAAGKVSAAASRVSGTSRSWRSIRSAPRRSLSAIPTSSLKAPTWSGARHRFKRWRPSMRRGRVSRSRVAAPTTCSCRERSSTRLLSASPARRTRPTCSSRSTWTFSRVSGRRWSRRLRPTPAYG